MAVAAAEPRAAMQRRILYGANVALNIVLAVIALALAVWGAGQIGGRWDLSSSRANSLSERTTRLLGSLDTDIRITALYTTALKEVRKFADKHKQVVEDLLDLYETAGGGHVTVESIDPARNAQAVKELIERLADKPEYKDEAEPHRKALEGFEDLVQRIQATVQSEVAQLEEFAKNDPKLNRQREVAIIARNFRTLADESQALLEEYAELMGGDLPRYGQAVQRARDYLTRVQQALKSASEWLSSKGTALPDLPPDAQQFFAEAPQRYEALLRQVEQKLEQLKDLKRVKLEELYDQLRRGQTIVVETPEKAEVLSYEDVWPFRPADAPPAADGDPRQFAGEQAVSSAILKLVQKQRTAVVFVRYGGSSLLEPDMTNFNPMQPPPRPPYARMAEILEKQNFLTAEWDLQKQDDPPTVEGAARYVYVVFPPRQPPRPNPMQPAPTPPISEDKKQKIYDAVGKSGMAIFLAPWEPANSFIPMARAYDFADYLKSDWGVEVKYTLLVLEFTPNPDREGLWVPSNRPPTVVTTRVFRFTDHPIARPLRSLPAGLFNVAPLLTVADDKMPEGVTVEPVAETRDTENIWAVSDISRIQQDLEKNFGTKPRPEDLRPPFALALAVQRGEHQRLVVFGSERFFSDDVLNLSDLLLTGGGLVAAQRYPANSELLLNAIYWVTNDADRIAVGPRSGDVPRLEDLEEGPVLKFWRVFLVGIWPGLALLAGIGVALLRRR